MNKRLRKYLRLLSLIIGLRDEYKQLFEHVAKLYKTSSTEFKSMSSDEGLSTLKTALVDLRIGDSETSVLTLLTNIAQSFNALAFFTQAEYEDFVKTVVVSNVNTYDCGNEDYVTETVMLIIDNPWSLMILLMESLSIVSVKTNR
jgi:hypothetical protein